MEENIKQEELKIRFNIKQTAKGDKYYDITVRGNTIEEIKTLFESAEKTALDLGCLKVEK